MILGKTGVIKFEGKFRNDRPNGNFCKFYNSDGFLVFLGNFCAGAPIFGIFFDKEIDSVKYIGTFSNYKLSGENCYQFGRGEKILASGKFLDGMPCPTDFKIYYKSGCVLYEAKNDDNIYGYVYHDGLFDQSDDRVVNNSIYLPYKKNDFWLDVNNLLAETRKGTNLMNMKYDYYDKHDNIKQVLLTTIKKNDNKKTLNYLVHNSKLDSIQNISIEIGNPGEGGNLDFQQNL